MQWSPLISRVTIKGVKTVCLWLHKHKEEEHEKQIVSDSMYKHNDQVLHPVFHCVSNSEIM